MPIPITTTPTATSGRPESEGETATGTQRRRAAPLPPGERRAAIIEAVLPLLIEQGSTVTSRQLATAAGVAEGTIFNVFGDKEALLAAAFETATDSGSYERAVGAIDASTPFEERLVRATALTQRRIADIWQLVTQLGPHHHPARPRPLPDSPALTALLAAEPGRLRLAPADGARLLRSLTFACTHPMLTPTPRSAAAIVELFLHGAQTGITSAISSGAPGAITGPVQP